MSEDNLVNGCKNCFCFGRTDICREQKNYVWSQLGGLKRKELFIRYLTDEIMIVVIYGNTTILDLFLQRQMHIFIFQVEEILD